MRDAILLAILVLTLAPLLLLRPDLSHALLVPAYTDAASRFLDIHGTPIHYKDQGSGPVLLLIHGTNASLHTWDGWIAELQDSFRLIRLDLPGHGLSGPARSGDYSIARYVDLLDTFVHALHIEHVSLAGNSMGGSIAWHYALAHPDTVAHLVLLDAIGYPAPHPFFFSVIGVPIVGRLTTLMTPRWLCDRTVRAVYGDDAKITPQTYARYYDLARHAGNRQAMHRLLRQWRTDDSARIIAIRQPTLILWGAADTFQAVRYARRFADDIPDSTVILYPGVGHVPMEEIPTQTAADVHRFLARQHGPGSVPVPGSPGRVVATSDHAQAVD